MSVQSDAYLEEVSAERFRATREALGGTMRRTPVWAWPAEEVAEWLGDGAEVLLKLPLDLATRNRANEVTQAPLQEIARFRMGAQRAQSIHRPRQVEWTILGLLMVLALLGFFVAWRAL